MRLDDLRESANLEDRRGQGGFGGGGFPGGRGGLGIGTVLILGLVGYALGIDPRILIGGAEILTGGGGPAITQPQRAPAQPGRPPADAEGRRVAAVLGLTEDVWKAQLPAQAGVPYREPTLVLFTGATRSACGGASAASGPFYCPLDQKLYMDLGFFDQMRRKFGVNINGDFAQAYVIAHEVGHHIQNLVGLLPKVQEAQQESGDKRFGNQLQVRVELQADCYAGVWAHHADARFRVLEPGDVEEALRAASAVGDDTLQQATQGRVVPESFTHGSAEQRQRWFTIGLKGGDMRACNTFQNGRG